MTDTKDQLIDDLKSKGTDMPCADLIKLFDQAAANNDLIKSDVAADIGRGSVIDLEDMFNKFTAEKHQHECPLTTKETQAPELDLQVKQVLVNHLNKAYNLGA